MLIQQLDKFNPRTQIEFDDRGRRSPGTKVCVDWEEIEGLSSLSEILEILINLMGTKSRGEENGDVGWLCCGAVLKLWSLRGLLSTVIFYESLKITVLDSYRLYQTGIQPGNCS